MVSFDLSRKVNFGLILGVAVTQVLARQNRLNNEQDIEANNLQKSLRKNTKSKHNWTRNQVVLKELWDNKARFIDGYLREHHEVDVGKENGLEGILGEDTGCWCQDILRNQTYEGHTLDKYDSLCKQLHQCVQCSEMSLCPEREDFSIYEEPIRGNTRNVGETGEIFRCNKRHGCAYGLCTCMKSFFINFAELVAFDLGTGVLPERLPVVSGKKSCGVKKRISSHFTDYSWKNEGEGENWEDWSRSLTIGGDLENSQNLQNGLDFGGYESSGDGTDIVLKGVASQEQLGNQNQDFNSTKINKVVFRAEKTVKFEIDACCGNLPDWKPYSTMGGERGCCAVKVFDKQFDTCCGGRVTEIGSCGLDDYKYEIQARSGLMQYDAVGFEGEEEEDYDEVDENDQNSETDQNSEIDQSSENVQNSVIDQNADSVETNMHLDDDFDFSDISAKHSFVAPECITNPSTTVTADQISTFCSEHQGYELTLWPERSCSKYVDCTQSTLNSCPTGQKFNGTSCTSSMTDYDCGIHFKYNEIPLAFEVTQDSQTKYIVLDEHHSAKYFCDKIKPGYFSSFVWLDWTCQKYVECYGDDHSAILSCDEGEIYNGVVRACVKSTSRRGQQCGEMFVEEHHFGHYQPVWRKGCL